MTTIDRIASALGHLNTFVKPGADDQASVAYVAHQLERAIAELAARQRTDIHLGVLIRCTLCGAPNRPDRTFCTTCGHRQHERTEQPCTSPLS